MVWLLGMSPFHSAALLPFCGFVWKTHSQQRPPCTRGEAGAAPRASGAWPAEVPPVSRWLLPSAPEGLHFLCAHTQVCDTHACTLVWPHTHAGSHADTQTGLPRTDVVNTEPHGPQPGVCSQSLLLGGPRWVLGRERQRQACPWRGRALPPASPRQHSVCVWRGPGLSPSVVWGSGLRASGRAADLGTVCPGYCWSDGPQRPPPVRVSVWGVPASGDRGVRTGPCLCSAGEGGVQGGGGAL